ncbi:MAG: type I restriction enzyme HsdR N-terminal domain-containing protein [Bacteroidales bacterium]|nr:type I restriction enzyme HsdR N-terminal domain-containing protein [Bacteroidales bacterium]HOL98294.1 type I restriction enzyme HsdR N-terminal domain-containing protein [Bacteroidales bacterium]HOM36634.1 type I restriction enzyme HsdR N-terminal domain-containing protein [Bacteroidales bacterium]HPD24073.1 type I restriction enzyme HsdR N-terminal domain-containing protein [Bacteroidales bacterium]HRT00062.1 type I restriction enzyme HsdR N-terminal domain-containing protein [Bacteroidal
MNYLPDLCFPKFEFRFRIQENKTYIFDEIRKSWIVLSPEEWVRQNLLKFLIENYAYPSSLIAVEKSLKIADKTLRFDALVFDRKANPLMLIECKATEVKLTQKVFDQIWIYNYEVNAPFFLVTNGVAFVMGSCFKDKKPEFFSEIKDYNSLLSLISE